MSSAYYQAQAHAYQGQADEILFQIELLKKKIAKQEIAITSFLHYRDNLENEIDQRLRNLNNVGYYSQTVVFSHRTEEVKNMVWTPLRLGNILDAATAVRDEMSNELTRHIGALSNLQAQYDVLQSSITQSWASYHNAKAEEEAAAAAAAKK